MSSDGAAAIDWFTAVLPELQLLLSKDYSISKGFVCQQRTDWQLHFNQLILCFDGF